MDITGVPLDQFGTTYPRGGGSTARIANNTLSSNNFLFCPADWVSPNIASVSGNISAITMPLMNKFLNATTEALMAHVDLGYDDLCVGYNLFEGCKDRNYAYRHTKAKPTTHRIKFVT
jgi:hypothetical protein